MGETLAQARDAVYLREPVTQSDPAFYSLGTIFDLDRGEIRESYQQLADKAFAGWPDFAEPIIPHPDRCVLLPRIARRLVIKEVNPLACGWYLGRYKPFVIHIVRHPAPVALSNQVREFLPPEPAAWERFGELQGRASRHAWESLRDYPTSFTIHYEALCADPVGTFHHLFDRAGLAWDRTIEGYIEADTAESWRMIDSWREKVPAETLDALRRGYSRYELPWYQADQDWSPSPTIRRFAEVG